MAAPAAAEELRIGYISPVTGIFAQVGKDMVDGFQLYLDEHGNKLGGMDVKFIVEDDQGKPDPGVTKAKKLILQDHVQMFIGGLLASTGYALAPVSTAEKTLYISSVSSADDLTQRQLGKYPYFMRTSWSSSLPHHALGQWACDNGFKKVITIAADYAFGYETVGGFQKAFEDCGGKVIQKIWPPLGTKDFGPYIPTFKADADAIFTTMVGPMALQFPKQLRAAGDKRKILGSGVSYDEFVLPFMGDEVIGDVSALHYSAAIETPKNRPSSRPTAPSTARCRATIRKTTTPPRSGSTRRSRRPAANGPGPKQFIKLMAEHQDRRAARAGRTRRHA